MVSLLRSAKHRVAVALAATVIAVAAGALWYVNETAELHAISELPAAERRALYERTLHTLKTSCAAKTKPSGLDEFCHEQAEFIVQFRECDRACWTVANLHRGPTR